ncbi:hypothetical protein IC620_15430 [Hazenella sp. IB182357]|uniref:Uncharacterized protein n=1 Tax=Polycladospora coralii TaxID=2771432 RepID=A0A926NCI5_9BACL|nr:hypothetical protein [Polycladospora coralii]MBD1373737.1 hypothetical protein [Polycladospora coralii]
MAKTYRYFLPNNKGEGWSLIILDQDGKECTLFANGDYDGHTARFYTDKDIRDFMLGVDSDYLLSKISTENVFNASKTEQSIKQKIIEARTSGRYDKQEAREEWTLLKDGIEWEADFHNWVAETRMGLYDAADLAYYEYPLRARAFAYQVLPRLQQVIRKDIENAS